MAIDDVLNGVYLWLAVSTLEKYARQIGSFPQVGLKIKNLGNHHPRVIFQVLPHPTAGPVPLLGRTRFAPPRLE